MKKRVLSIIAMLAMTVSMAACSSGGSDTPAPTPTEGEEGGEVSSDAGDLITVGYAQVLMTHNKNKKIKLKQFVLLFNKMLTT